jgi:lipoprotein-anchoring transpeptidase ErfK/SrfK
VIRRARLFGGLVVVATLSVSAAEAPAWGGELEPPWIEAGDIPLPEWARTMTPTRVEVPIVVDPDAPSVRRGTVQLGARLSVFGTRRGQGCLGRWVSVGPFAWVCSDSVELSEESAFSPPLGVRPWTFDGEGAVDWLRPQKPGTRTELPPIAPASASEDGLPYRYFVAGRDGAYGYATLESAFDDAPDQELEAGFFIAILEERTEYGERWGRAGSGRWFAMRELVPVRPSLFHGDLLPDDSAMDVAWVVADKASVFTTEKLDRPLKPPRVRARFERVRVFEHRPGKDGGAVRVSSDEEPAAWMRARDLARPSFSEPPSELSADNATERWIDVDLSSQTLVAYEGKRPVFATLVSTGRGPAGTEFATHVGTFRIWSKLFSTTMDNLDADDAEHRYAIEDVPWVQFFDRGIGLHAAFWHRNFGRVHSHGCVNLAPIDARWLFAFTSPHLPQGWTAVLPTPIDQGTIVRVR